MWKLAHLSCKIATRLLLSLPCCWHLLLVANGALCIVFPAHSVLRGPTPGPAFGSNLDRKYFATSLGDDACYLLLFSRIHELDGAWWTVSLIFSFFLRTLLAACNSQVVQDLWLGTTCGFVLIYTVPVIKFLLFVITSEYNGKKYDFKKYF